MPSDNYQIPLETSYLYSSNASKCHSAHLKFTILLQCSVTWRCINKSEAGLPWSIIWFEPSCRAGISTHQLSMTWMYTIWLWALSKLLALIIFHPMEMKWCSLALQEIYILIRKIKPSQDSLESYEACSSRMFSTVPFLPYHFSTPSSYLEIIAYLLICFWMRVHFLEHKKCTYIPFIFSHICDQFYIKNLVVFSLCIKYL